MSIDIHVFEFRDLPSEAPPWAVHLQRDLHAATRLLIAVLRKLEQVEKEVKMADHNIDEVIALAKDESTQIDGLKAFIQGLKDQIASMGGIPADVQTKINDLFDTATSNDNALKAMQAINEGTPAEGTDPSAPAAS